MSQTKFPFYVFGLVSVLLAGSAMAQDDVNTPRIDQRQAKQERRIDQGIASGSLTRKEASRLNHQQGRIDTLENRARSDGQVSAHERKHLAHAQNKANRSIQRQKHDRQVRRG